MKENKDLNRLLILATKKQKHGVMSRTIIRLKFWLEKRHAEKLIRRARR